MKTMTPWILMTALGLFGLVNCSSDEDDDGGGGTSGTSAGKGGTSGASGKGGSAGVGKGGSAGTAGKGGGAGSAGSAGAAGSPEGGAGAGGEAGTAGAEGGTAGAEGGAAGDGPSAGAGAGGVGGSDDGAAGAGGEAGAAALTDARILHIVITANDGEVAEGQLALTRATDPAVLSFADEMVTEHGAATTEANALAAAESITPETNPISEMLAEKSTQTVAELTAIAAEEFDVAYMESQVTAHTEVLALIDDQLLVEADNAALVEYLEGIRAHVAAHLLDAETTLDEL